MPDIQITTNYERAVEVAKAAIGMLERKTPPFNKENLFPDADIPDGVPKEFFLFYGCSLDSMRRADEVYKVLRALARKTDISRLHEAKKQVLERVLEAHFGEGVEEAVGSPLRTLIENSRQLEKYGGNPVNLKTGTVEETIARISEFYQFGRQKAALFMKNMVRFGFWDFPETEIPIKVDRHVIRISLGTGVVDDYSAAVIKNPGELEGKHLNEGVELLIAQGFFTREDYEAGRIEVVRAEKFQEPLSEEFRRVTSRNSLSSIKLDDALWAIGANGCAFPSYCMRFCSIECKRRPASDNSATYFFPGIDKRKKAGYLFF